MSLLSRQSSTPGLLEVLANSSLLRMLVRLAVEPSRALLFWLLKMRYTPAAGRICLYRASNSLRRARSFTVSSSSCAMLCMILN